MSDECVYIMFTVFVCAHAYALVRSVCLFAFTLNLLRDMW